MSPFVKITRPVNLVFLAFTMLGVILLGNEVNFNHQVYSVSNFWIGLLLIFILCSMFAAGYVINDWFDVETDQLNKSEKQIVEVLITRNQALWYYFILVFVCTILTVILTLVTGKTSLFLVVSIMQLVLFLYSKALKKTLFVGNFVVANFLALPYFLIAYVFDFFAGDSAMILILYALASSAILLNFLREVAKDWEDLKGDLKIGARTFVIRYGEKLTRDLLCGFVVLSVVLHLVLLQFFALKFGPSQCLVLTWPLMAAVMLHLPFIPGLGKSQWPASLVSKRLKLLMFFGVLWVYYLWVYALSI